MKTYEYSLSFSQNITVSYSHIYNVRLYDELKWGEWPFDEALGHPSQSICNISTVMLPEVFDMWLKS